MLPYLWSHHLRRIPLVWNTGKISYGLGFYMNHGSRSVGLGDVVSRPILVLKSTRHLVPRYSLPSVLSNKRILPGPAARFLRTVRALLSVNFLLDLRYCVFGTSEQHTIFLAWWLGCVCVCAAADCVVTALHCITRAPVFLDSILRLASPHSKLPLH